MTTINVPMASFPAVPSNRPHRAPLLMWYPSPRDFPFHASPAHAPPNAPRAPPTSAPRRGPMTGIGRLMKAPAMLPIVVPATANTIPRRLPPRFPATAALAKNSTISPKTARPARIATPVQPIPCPGGEGTSAAKSADSPTINQLPGSDKVLRHHAAMLASVSNKAQT